MSYSPTTKDIGPELGHGRTAPTTYFCETCIQRIVDVKEALWHISQGHHVVNHLGVRQVLTPTRAAQKQSAA